MKKMIDPAKIQAVPISMCHLFYSQTLKKNIFKLFKRICLPFCSEPFKCLSQYFRKGDEKLCIGANTIGAWQIHSQKGNSLSNLVMCRCEFYRKILMHISFVFFFYSVRTLRGVSAHVFTWYHWRLQNKQGNEMDLIFVLSLLGNAFDTCSICHDWSHCDLNLDTLEWVVSLDCETKCWKICEPVRFIVMFSQRVAQWERVPSGLGVLAVCQRWRSIGQALNEKVNKALNSVKDRFQVLFLLTKYFFIYIFSYFICLLQYN